MNLLMIIAVEERTKVRFLFCFFKNLYHFLKLFDIMKYVNHTEESMDKVENFPFGIDQVIIKDNFPLAPMSTIKIGGIARYAAFPKTEDSMCELVHAAKKHGVRYVVIGCGSNVIFPDGKFDGMVIFTKSIDHININGNIANIGCGAKLPYISHILCERELSGAEFLCGIPGSIGGAVCMNAGAYGSSVSDIFISGKIFSPSVGIVEADKNDLKFSYRNSILKNSEFVLLEAAFKLTSSEKDKICGKTNEYKAQRVKSQPTKLLSAGSVFLAVNGVPAWKYVDGANMRGAVVGGAEVSQKHAGFIINRGEARASDVAELIDKIKYNVFKKYNIELETELVFIK